jgi:UDP-glucose-4-epimerase GalE
MKKILVTGGAGYIGSHTCKALALAGYEPITYDNLSTGHADAVKWGPLVTGDLEDKHKLSGCLRQYKPTAVVHFAASAYVGESVSNPFKYYQNNVGGSLSLLEAMRSQNLDKIVFSSTCATYGMPDLQLINEECLQQPINPYGQSKLMIEQILRDLSNQRQLKQISLRYFNAAGDDKEGEIGERHNPETHLIPLAISSAFEGPELKIFGTDYQTPDGTAVRDYLHVQDISKAHILALEYLFSGGESNFINLGTGKGHSVKEIITCLQELGISVRASNAPRRAGDPAFLVANPLKANTLLKWQPEYTNIKDILKTAITWHTKV